MTDSRFFDGYVWCSILQGCEQGLCVKSDNAQLAAKKYAENYRRIHGENDLVKVYTMVSAENAAEVFFA